MIFDTHAHYNDAAFAADLDEILAQFPQFGIESAVNVASDLESLDEVQDLADRYPFFYAALGIHPSDCAPMNKERLEDLERRCVTGRKIVAVGEIGLDYHWDEPQREVQQLWFQEQLLLAGRVGLPVIIHSRDAAQDTMDILRRFHAKDIGGVIHCYSYSPEMAEEFVKMGFFIGIGGVLTFKNAKRLKETARRIPLSSIVLETDCPYMAPSPHRGERNSSLYLPLVASELAQIKGVPTQEIIDETRRNALKLYRLR